MPTGVVSGETGATLPGTTVVSCSWTCSCSCSSSGAGGVKRFWHSFADQLQPWPEAQIFRQAPISSACDFKTPGPATQKYKKILSSKKTVFKMDKARNRL